MLSDFLQLKLDVTTVCSLSEWNGYYLCLSVFPTAKWFLSTWLVLWKIPDAVLISICINPIPKPKYAPFRCLLLFVFNYLCEQGWILGEANERRSPRTPSSEILRAWVCFFAETFRLYFAVTNWSLKHFGNLSYSCIKTRCNSVH